MCLINRSESSPYPYRSEFIFRGCAVWVGEFVCHHAAANFGGLRSVKGHHLIVFPRLPVKIKLSRKETLIASPNSTIFYNYQTEYERSKLNDFGDWCNYFLYNRELLLEILSAYTPEVCDHPQRPFHFVQAYLSPENYVHQQRLINLIEQQNESQTLQIDELAIALLEQIVADFFAQENIRPNVKKATKKAHGELAVAAQELIAKQFAQQLSLKQIAAALFVSPYHLHRIFRQQTGCTLHQYLEQIRLRTAFERLGDYTHNITQLALEVGYATHSHFTDAFHRTFDFPPSQWEKIK